MSFSGLPSRAIDETNEEGLPLAVQLTRIMSRSASNGNPPETDDGKADLLKRTEDEKTTSDIERCDEENTTAEGLKEETVERAISENTQFLAWIIINTLATIGIVFTNKAIFADAKLRLCQSSFAAFHFTVTAATLYAVSRPSVALFTPSRVAFFQMLPLSLAMCLNVILPNLSLAFSSIAFYQIVRVLLTPLTAGINFVCYGTKIPKTASYTLIPICLGVAMVSYYDTKPVRGTKLKTTSPAGVLFAFTGVFASACYTVWIGTYHKKFHLNSMQLLFNQAPWSALLLLYVIPFTDTNLNWSRVPESKWVLILLSGLFASLINISQFFIVAGSGAVSSTVVGHLKTCSIVALGWMTSGRKVDDKSVVGILTAILGIMAYSTIMFQHKKQQGIV